MNRVISLWLLDEEPESGVGGWSRKWRETDRIVTWGRTMFGLKCEHGDDFESALLVLANTWSCNNHSTIR